MFNALKYTKDLEENGFAREQAEILVSLFMQMIEFNMVTKNEFEQLKSEMGHGFENFENMITRSEFEQLKTEMHRGFEIIDQRFESMVTRSEFDRLKSEMHRGFEIINQRFESIDKRFESMVTRSEFNQFKSEMRHGFEVIDQKIERLTLQLTVKLGVMLALSMGLLSTIIALKF